jgi:hypothetical protein
MTTVQQGPRAVAARLAAEVFSKGGFFRVAPNGAVIEWTEIHWLRIAGIASPSIGRTSTSSASFGSSAPSNEPE